MEAIKPKGLLIRRMLPSETISPSFRHTHPDLCRQVLIFSTLKMKYAVSQSILKSIAIFATFYLINNIHIYLYIHVHICRPSFPFSIFNVVTHHPSPFSPILKSSHTTPLPFSHFKGTEMYKVDGFWFMVFNTTCRYISVISLWSVLLLEGTWFFHLWIILCKPILNLKWPRYLHVMLR